MNHQIGFAVAVVSVGPCELVRIALCSSAQRNGKGGLDWGLGSWESLHPSFKL